MNHSFRLLLLCSASLHGALLVFFAGTGETSAVSANHGDVAEIRFVQPTEARGAAAEEEMNPAPDEPVLADPKCSLEPVAAAQPFVQASASHEAPPAEFDFEHFEANAPQILTVPALEGRVALCERQASFIPGDFLDAPLVVSDAAGTVASPRATVQKAGHAYTPQQQGQSRHSDAVDREPLALSGNPKPVYPPRARDRGYEGLVVLRAQITHEGFVGTLSVQTSTGYALLDQAALHAIKKWRFQPAEKSGRRVPCVVEVPFRFRLEDR